MNFQKTSAIALAISFALIVLVSEFAVANEDDKEQQQPTSSESSEIQEQEVGKIMKDTYMGVDANDKEAVEKRIRELSLHKWNEMFGPDADIDGVDFAPDFSGGLLEQAKQKIKNALEVLRKYIKNRRNSRLSTTTTQSPQVDQENTM